MRRIEETPLVPKIGRRGLLSELVRQSEAKALMSRFNAGDRVYHLRKNDPEGYEGYGTILEIVNGIHAMLLWEDSKQRNVVEMRDLMTEEDAEKIGLI